MRFATPICEKEFREELHPESRTVGEELDAYCRSKGYGEAHVTEVVRTDDESQRIYLPIARRVRAKLSIGETLTDEESEILRQTDGMDEDALAQWARKKPSWHKWKTGTDYGTAHLTLAQRATVAQWVRKRCPAGPWEVKTETHGTGPHLHVARRDFSWRNTFPKEKK